MKYKESLNKIKENLKFLELKESMTLGKVSLKKDFVIPINRDSVESLEKGTFHFNFFHLVQNILFCTALCDDLPLNQEYDKFLKDLFENTDKKYLEALLDLRSIEDPLYRGGVLMSYSKYGRDYRGAMMSSYEFLDLYQAEEDEDYLDLAKAQLLKAKSISNTAYCNYLLSYVHHVKGEYDLALDYMDFALELNPDDNLKEAIQSDQNEIGLLLEITTARNLMAQGDYVGAFNYLRDKEREENWEQKYMLGEICLALHSPERAIDYLKTALELNPTEPDIYESLGVASYFLGDVGNSIKFLEHGLKLDPKHLEILKNLASLYSKTGRSEIGIKLLEKAKVFYPEDTELDDLIGKMKERLDV